MKINPSSLYTFTHPIAYNTRMKKPNDMDTLLSLPIDLDRAMALFAKIVTNAERANLDLSKGSALEHVLFNFGLQAQNQGFLKLSETECSRTSKNGLTTFELPCWGVMEVSSAILALDSIVSKEVHHKHILLWNPFMQKAYRIMDFGATEESAGGENFLSMN